MLHYICIKVEINKALFDGLVVMFVLGGGVNTTAASILLAKVLVKRSLEEFK